MSKKKYKKVTKNLLDNMVSANECTGSYQSANLDTDQLEEYQREFNKGKKKKN